MCSTNYTRLHTLYATRASYTRRTTSYIPFVPTTSPGGSELLMMDCRYLATADTALSATQPFPTVNTCTQNFRCEPEASSTSASIVTVEGNATLRLNQSWKDHPEIRHRRREIRSCGCAAGRHLNRRRIPPGRGLATATPRRHPPRRVCRRGSGMERRWMPNA